MSETGLIELDEGATAEVRSLLTERGYDLDEAGLRLAVERGGCAGLSYTIELTASPAPDGLVTTHDGVRVFVDAASEPYLAGAELGIELTAHGLGFTIDNPNATQECGCGLSFR